jgi:site-specific recombinase XerD
VLGTLPLPRERLCVASAPLGHNGRRKLFCPLDGRTFKQSYVRHLLRRLADKAGVERRVHPHALRHTYSAEWLARARP